MKYQDYLEKINILIPFLVEYNRGDFGFESNKTRKRVTMECSDVMICDGCCFEYSGDCLSVVGGTSLKEHKTHFELLVQQYREINPEEFI